MRYACVTGVACLRAAGAAHVGGPVHAAQQRPVHHSAEGVRLPDGEEQVYQKRKHHSGEALGSAGCAAADRLPCYTLHV